MHESIKLGVEHLGSLINIPTSREIMSIYSAGAEDRFDAAVRHNLVRYRDRVLSISQVTNLERQAAVNRQRELPVFDDLTGAYSRRDFYTFMAICKELGHDAVWVIPCDMNYLKDYNLRLGEPSGGDFALVAVVRVLENVASQIGFFTVRYQLGGGDDFLLVGFPPSVTIENNDLTIEKIGKMIDEKFKQILPDEFFNGIIGGKRLTTFSTGQELTLNPQMVEKLRKESNLLRIIIPPSVVHDAVILDPSTQIRIYHDPTGKESYDFTVVAGAIETAYSRIKEKKLVLYQEIGRRNSAGASKLARRENNA